MASVQMPTHFVGVLSETCMSGAYLGVGIPVTEYPLQRMPHGVATTLSFQYQVEPPEG